MHGQRLADAGIQRPPPVSKWDHLKGHPAPELPIGPVSLPAHLGPLTGVFPKNTPHWTLHTWSPTQAAYRSPSEDTQLLLLINKHSNLSNSYWAVLSKDWTFVECICWVHLLKVCQDLFLFFTLTWKSLLLVLFSWWRGGAFWCGFWSSQVNGGGVGVEILVWVFLVWNQALNHPTITWWLLDVHVTFPSWL